MQPADIGEALDWDLFCRVIDNHGDLGVCWRLARRLAALGQRVRLWVDDASALAWMAPHGAHGVRVLPWREPVAGERAGDVVVEAFGCNPPPAFVARMAAGTPPPVWINLEYLSAEGHAERSHGLASPQASGPGAGLTKWFFYPGFTARGGGLLLEDDLPAQRDGFDATAGLAALGAAPQAGQRISLFGYEQPALGAWLEAWQREPTQLLVAPGAPARQVASWLGASADAGSMVQRGQLQAHFLPWLTQPGYDRLLWSCTLNHVRGEDSLVRALWAGRPFVWQLYAQSDGAHRAKLEAFLDLYLEGASPALARSLRARFRGCNGGDAAPTPVDAIAWQAHARGRSAALQAASTQGGDLASRLYGFARGKR